MINPKLVGRSLLVLLIIIFVSSTMFRCHKEHSSEHPMAKGGAGLTIEEFADAIDGYVAKIAKSHNGVFPVRDRVTGQVLMLTLVKIHKERLAKVAPDEYFACVDFNTPEGVVYDIDIFMKGPDKDSLELTNVSVHKVDGKERYTWYEESGVWKQKPITEVGSPK